MHSSTGGDLAGWQASLGPLKKLCPTWEFSAREGRKRLKILKKFDTHDMMQKKEKAELDLKRRKREAAEERLRQKLEKEAEIARRTKVVTDEKLRKEKEMIIAVEESLPLEGRTRLKLERKRSLERSDPGEPFGEVSDGLPYLNTPNFNDCLTLLIDTVPTKPYGLRSSSSSAGKYRKYVDAISDISEGLFFSLDIYVYN